MIREMLSNTWFWALAGLFLMAAEIILPGIYLMFVGGAALVIAVLFWLVPGFPIWLAAVIFVSLGVVGILWGRHLSRTQDGEQAQALNDRGSLLVGRAAVLVSVTTPGHGTVKVGDTTWRAKWTGNDPTPGDVMTIDGVDSTTLKVSRPSEEN